MNLTDWVLFFGSLIVGSVAGYYVSGSLPLAALSAFACLGVLVILFGIGAWVDERLSKHYRKI